MGPGAATARRSPARAGHRSRAGRPGARTAAERGHEVLLVEEQAQIGGQYRLSARLPTRAEFGRLLDWYGAELERLKVDVSLSTRADVALVERIGPDAVVIATGSVGATPDIPGIDLPRVADLREWLAQWLDRSPAVPDEETVTVWGADRVGVAAADVLAARGARVLLLGAQPELAPEAGRREKILVVPRLRANPRVRIELGATLEAVEPDRLLVGRGRGVARGVRAGPRLARHRAGPTVARTGRLEDVRYRRGVPRHRARADGRGRRAHPGRFGRRGDPRGCRGRPGHRLMALSHANPCNA